MSTPTPTAIEGVTRRDFGISEYSRYPWCEYWFDDKVSIEARKSGVRFDIGTERGGFWLVDNLEQLQTVLGWCARHVASLRAGKGPVEQGELEGR